MLNSTNISIINNLGPSNVANCWGSTKYALGYTKTPIWEELNAMDSFLRYNTVKVTGKLMKGDILVCRDKNRTLLHTAIYHSYFTWWHKPGRRAAEYNLESGILGMYHETKIVEYRRFVPRTGLNKKKPNLSFKIFLAFFSCMVVKNNLRQGIIYS